METINATIEITDAGRLARREYKRKYYQENRERLNEYHRNYCAEHRDKIRETNRRYWNRRAERETGAEKQSEV